MGGPRRQWWKRKRWLAATLLWLVAAYPLSVGPAEYATQRGWLSAAARDVAYWPLGEAERFDRLCWLRGRLYGYRAWFAELAWRHDPDAGLIVCGPAWGDTEEDLIAYGRVLYEQRGCVICHDARDGGRVGPDLRETIGGGHRLADSTTAAGDDAYVRESIIAPQAKVRLGFRPVMPSYDGQLSAKALDALTAYVRSLRAEAAAPGPTERTARRTRRGSGPARAVNWTRSSPPAAERPSVRRRSR